MFLERDSPVEIPAQRATPITDILEIVTVVLAIQVL
jgi:hypothetical protein